MSFYRKLYSTRRYRMQKGMIMVLFGISLIALFGVAALTVDMGYAYLHKIKLQRTADSAALSAALEVHTANSPTTRAQQMFVANGMPVSDIISLECGDMQVENRVFLPCANPCNDPNACTACTDCSSVRARAVRLVAQDTVPSFFSRFFGTSALSTQVVSVARALFNDSSNCTRPFGINGGNNGPLRNVSVGQTFVVGSNGSGNWGRLDVGPVPLNGNNFSNYMMSGVCDSELSVNQSVPVVTGNAQGTGTIFQNMKNLGLTDYMILPVTSQFPNGNSGTVTIQSFIVATLISVDIPNGNNFTATFRLDAVGINPPDGGGTGAVTSRVLQGQKDVDTPATGVIGGGI